MKFKFSHMPYINACTAGVQGAQSQLAGMLRRTLKDFVSQKCKVSICIVGLLIRKEEDKPKNALRVIEVPSNPAYKVTEGFLLVEAWTRENFVVECEVMCTGLDVVSLAKIIRNSTVLTQRHTYSMSKSVMQEAVTYTQPTMPTLPDDEVELYALRVFLACLLDWYTEVSSGNYPERVAIQESDVESCIDSFANSEGVSDARVDMADFLNEMEEKLAPYFLTRESGVWNLNTAQIIEFVGGMDEVMRLAEVFEPMVEPETTRPTPFLSIDSVLGFVQVRTELLEEKTKYQLEYNEQLQHIEALKAELQLAEENLVIIQQDLDSVEEDLVIYTITPEYRTALESLLNDEK
jgi:hypothetical protein